MDELVALCAECGIEDTLDPKMKICFECWSLLDLKEHEKAQTNDLSSVLIDETEEE